LDGDQLVVEVQSPYAKEWLEERLNATIERTVAGITGRHLAIRYEVGNGSHVAE
jgi:chromosomal replication initiation ATPase DnaA